MRMKEWGRRKEEEARRKEDGGRRKEEGRSNEDEGMRKKEGGRRKEEIFWFFSNKLKVRWSELKNHSKIIFDFLFII